jgi:hypothetical protein
MTEGRDYNAKKVSYMAEDLSYKLGKCGLLQKSTVILAATVFSLTAP